MGELMNEGNVLPPLPQISGEQENASTPADDDIRIVVDADVVAAIDQAAEQTASALGMPSGVIAGVLGLLVGCFASDPEIASAARAHSVMRITEAMSDIVRVAEALPKFSRFSKKLAP